MKDNFVGDNVLILERSQDNLKKVNDKNKTVLEGIFAEFGRENRNGRIYEEKEYLPHLEYLKKDIKNGSLLGELDHPERFEVALSNVSHRVTDLWYDQANRVIRGKVEVLEGTPKGQLAKSLLEAGIPLAISSRAAGTVNDDSTVEIQQIYTYDLVAKPGFDSAQLSLSENEQPKLKQQVEQLNESLNKFDEKYEELSKDLGIINENISIYDVNDQFPLKIREEAKRINSSKNKRKNFEMKENQNQNPNQSKSPEEVIQQWTVYFNDRLSKLDEKFERLEKSILNEGKGNTGSAKELKKLKSYVENLRKIQEDSLNWQGDIAKAVNKVANYADNLAEKSNEHYGYTQKIAETVDHNAKTLNKTQDWVSENAKVTNAIGETVDHNAEMLNQVNEWSEEQAKAINALNEWGEEKARAINELNEWAEEKAKAINNMHEWTSSIAKGLNETAGYTEEMLGRAVSKEEAQKLMEYINLVAESRKNPKLKKKLDETLKKNSITGKKLSESMPQGLGTITDVKTVQGTKYDVENKGKENVPFDEKSKTIVKKMKDIKFQAGKKPGELESKDNYVPKQEFKGNKSKESNLDWLDPKKVKKSGKVDPTGGKAGKGSQPKGTMTLDIYSGHGKSKKVKPVVKYGKEGKNVGNYKNYQNMKLNTKSSKKGSHANESLNESQSIQNRSSKLDEKLGRIINNVEKEKTTIDKTKEQYPFTGLLGEQDIRKFAGLSQTDKKKVANEVAKHPTNDSDVIKKLWENALAGKKNEEPLWLKAAPKKYKEKFNNAPKQVQETIKARANFYDLQTQYQINNFWETSGLNVQKSPKLNETVTAKTSSNKVNEQYDSFVNQVGSMLDKYNRK